MLNTAASVYETRAFYVVMSLERADKQETTKEPPKTKKNNLQKEIDKLTFVLNGLEFAISTSWWG